MEKEILFKNITDTMLELYKNKNHDYGDSVHKTFEEFGLTAFLVRLSDKLNRVITLNKKEAFVHNEKIQDTLIDMANYCILALIELEGKNDKKNG